MPRTGPWTLTSLHVSLAIPAVSGQTEKERHEIAKGQHVPARTSRHAPALVDFWVTERV